jgi:hypothetical protein
MRNEDGFVEHLMMIVNSREVDNVMRTVAVACLNDNVKNYYSNTEGEIIGPKDKRHLMTHLVDSITLSFEVAEISETYQEILSKVCKSEYPHNWPQLMSEVTHKMYNASEVRELTGSLQTINTLVSWRDQVGIYRNSVDNERMPFEILLVQVLPFLQNLLVNQLQNWTDISPSIVRILLKVFSMAVHQEVPRAVKASDLNIWMLAIKQLLDRDPPEHLRAKLLSWDEIYKREQTDWWKIKSLCTNIVWRYAPLIQALSAPVRHEPLASDPRTEPGVLPQVRARPLRVGLHKPDQGAHRVRLAENPHKQPLDHHLQPRRRKNLRAGAPPSGRHAARPPRAAALDQHQRRGVRQHRACPVHLQPQGLDRRPQLRQTQGQRAHQSALSDASSRQSEVRVQAAEFRGLQS